MKINTDNRITVENQTFVATLDCLKKSQTVLAKIKFTDDEKRNLSKVNFDFGIFDDYKRAYSESQTDDNLNDIKAHCPKFLYLKQRKKDAEPVIIAIAFDGQVFLNKNVDDKIGVGAEATRYKYMAYINAFIKAFLIEDNVGLFDGDDFICTESALDDRRNDGPKSTVDCLDW